MPEERRGRKGEEGGEESREREGGGGGRTGPYLAELKVVVQHVVMHSSVAATEDIQHACTTTVSDAAFRKTGVRAPSPARRPRETPPSAWAHHVFQEKGTRSETEGGGGGERSFTSPAGVDLGELFEVVHPSLEDDLGGSRVRSLDDGVPRNILIRAEARTRVPAPSPLAPSTSRIASRASWFLPPSSLVDERSARFRPPPLLQKGLLVPSKPRPAYSRGANSPPLPRPCSAAQDANLIPASILRGLRGLLGGTSFCASCSIAEHPGMPAGDL